MRAPSLDIADSVVDFLADKDFVHEVIPARGFRQLSDELSRCQFDRNTGIFGLWHIYDLSPIILKSKLASLTLL